MMLLLFNKIKILKVINLYYTGVTLPRSMPLKGKYVNLMPLK